MACRGLYTWRKDILYLHDSITAIKTADSVGVSSIKIYKADGTYVTTITGTVSQYVEIHMLDAYRRRVVNARYRLTADHLAQVSLPVMAKSTHI